MLVFNQELRFPRRLPGVGNRVGGGIFYDAGNVFSRLGMCLFDSAARAVFDPAQPTLSLTALTSGLFIAHRRICSSLQHAHRSGQH